MGYETFRYNTRIHLGTDTHIIDSSFLLLIGSLVVCRCEWPLWTGNRSNKDRSFPLVVWEGKAVREGKTVWEGKAVLWGVVRGLANNGEGR